MCHSLLPVAWRGGQNGLSATGLVELGTILTAKDRLGELTHRHNWSTMILPG
jgi:hypothetical protein